MPPIRSLSVTKKGLLQRGLSLNKKGHLGKDAESVSTKNANKTFTFVNMKETFGSFKEVKSAPSWDSGGDDVEENSFAEMLRIYVKSLLAYSRAGIMYEWCLLFLSIISCIQFILDTYVPVELPDSRDNISLYLVGTASKIFELLLSGIFTFDFLLSLFIADHRWEFLGR